MHGTAVKPIYTCVYSIAVGWVDVFKLLFITSYSMDSQVSLYIERERVLASMAAYGSPINVYRPMCIGCRRCCIYVECVRVCVSLSVGHLDPR